MQKKNKLFISVAVIVSIILLIIIGMYVAKNAGDDVIDTGKTEPVTQEKVEEGYQDSKVISVPQETPGQLVDYLVVKHDGFWELFLESSEHIVNFGEYNGKIYYADCREGIKTIDVNDAEKQSNLAFTYADILEDKSFYLLEDGLIDNGVLYISVDGNLLSVNLSDNSVNKISEKCSTRSDVILKNGYLYFLNASANQEYDYHLASYDTKTHVVQNIGDKYFDLIAESEGEIILTEQEESASYDVNEYGEIDRGFNNYYKYDVDADEFVFLVQSKRGQYPGEAKYVGNDLYYMAGNNISKMSNEEITNVYTEQDLLVSIDIINNQIIKVFTQCADELSNIYIYEDKIISEESAKELAGTISVKSGDSYLQLSLLDEELRRIVYMRF